jgi:hypothetical protein
VAQEEVPVVVLVVLPVVAQMEVQGQQRRAADPEEGREEDLEEEEGRAQRRRALGKRRRLRAWALVGNTARLVAAEAPSPWSLAVAARGPAPGWASAGGRNSPAAAGGLWEPHCRQCCLIGSWGPGVSPNQGPA